MPRAVSDGLNDGFDEAAANAERFETLLTELEQIHPGGPRPAGGDATGVRRLLRSGQTYG